jgi:hypothetical protein
MPIDGKTFQVLLLTVQTVTVEEVILRASTDCGIAIQPDLADALSTIDIATEFSLIHTAAACTPCVAGRIRTRSKRARRSPRTRRLSVWLT